IARAIAAASWLSEADLAACQARWVQPMRIAYRGYEVLELPPPTQGVVALEALGLLPDGEPGLAAMVRAVALALEDGAAHVRDGADVSALLDEELIARRRGQSPRPVAPVD